MIYTCLSGYASDRVRYQPAETGPSRVAGNCSLPSPDSTTPLSSPLSRPCLRLIRPRLPGSPRAIKPNKA